MIKITLIVEDDPKRNVVEQSWLDFVNDRRERFGYEVDLGYVVEDPAYALGKVRGVSDEEVKRLSDVIHRLREEWVVFPRKLCDHEPKHVPVEANGFQVCECGATRRVEKGKVVGGWHECSRCVPA